MDALLDRLSLKWLVNARTLGMCDISVPYQLLADIRDVFCNAQYCVFNYTW